MASFKQAGPKPTSCISVILQGADHSAFDPGETRSINLPPGLWGYLYMAALASAPCGFRAAGQWFVRFRAFLYLDSQQLGQHVLQSKKLL